MNRSTALRKAAVVVGAVAVVGAVTAPLANAAPTQPAPGYGVWYGDVDGDGADDRLTLERAADGIWSVRADLADGTTSSSRLSDDDRIPDVGLRVADVDSDRVDEVLAPTSVGANTLTFALLTHRPGVGLTPVTTADGSPLPLYEGGGVAAVNGYSCTADHDEGTFDVVGATLQDGPGTLYTGSRTTYVIDDGVATPVHVGDIRDATRDDPALATDPDSCGPTA